MGSRPPFARHRGDSAEIEQSGQLRTGKRIDLCGCDDMLILAIRGESGIRRGFQGLAVIYRSVV